MGLEVYSFVDSDNCLFSVEREVLPEKIAREDTNAEKRVIIPLHILIVFKNNK